MSMNSEATIILKDGSLMISGDINFATVMTLWEQSLPLLEKQTHCQIDFSNVRLANSTSLALILEWIKYANQHAKTIQFNHLPVQVMSIAKAAGLEKLL